MCVVSMVGDHYSETYPVRYPDLHPWISTESPSRTKIDFRETVSKEEFDALKRDVEEMKELLKRAKKYDEDNNEPDCEMEDKIALLRKVAELVGVDLDEVFGSVK